MLQNARIKEAKSARLEVLHCSTSSAESKNIYCTLPSQCEVCKNSTKPDVNETQVNEPEDDIASEVDSYIRDCVGKSNLDIDKTCRLVASQFNLHNLSSLDENFVKCSYASICFELWLSESVLLCDNIDSDEVDECLQGLKAFRSIGYPQMGIIFQSKFFKLLSVNVAGKIPEPNEQQLVEDFKKNMRDCLLRHNGRTKIELEFIWALLKYIRSDSNFDAVSEKLQLRSFCTSQISFSDFTAILTEVLQGELGQRVLNHLNLLDGKISLQDRLIKILGSYMQTPKTTVKKISDFVYVELTGSIVRLAEVLPEIVYHVTSDSSIQEVRLLIGDTLHLDADVLKDQFHGKNFVICSPRVVVAEDRKVTIDVSGENCLKKLSPAARNVDGSGRDGTDGLPGESGGNIHIMAEEILNAENLSLLSNGGKGGRGQDGGSGVKGKNGVGMKEKVMKNDFLVELGVMSKDIRVPNEKIKELIDKISDSNELLEHPEVKDGFYRKWITKNSMEITLDFFASSVRAGMVFLCKGAPGEKGGSGGFGGLGGEGGYGGEIIVLDTSVSTTSDKGEAGVPGENGSNGLVGKDGWDVGYMDRFWSPTDFYGLKLDRKITIKMFPSPVKRSIWSGFSQKHIILEEVEKVPLGIQQQRQQASTTARQQRQNHAKAERQRSVTKSELKNWFNDAVKATVSDRCFELEMKNLEQSSLQMQSLHQRQQGNREKQIKRDIPILPKRRNRHIFECRSNEKSCEEIFDPSGNIKQEIVPRIKRIKLTNNDVESLAALVSSNGFKTSEILSDEVKENVTHVALANYKRIKFKNINITPNPEIHKDENESLINQRYLQISLENSNVFHETLQSIDNYIRCDALAQRKIVSEYLRATLLGLLENGNLQSALMNFLMVVGRLKIDSSAFSIFNKDLGIAINKTYCSAIHSLICFQNVLHSELQQSWETFIDGGIDERQFSEELSNKENHVELTVAFVDLMRSLSKTFDWKNIANDRDLMETFYETIQHSGLNFNGYVHLLAGLFKTQIILYTQRNEIFRFNCTQECSKKIHILKLNETKHEIATIDSSLKELDDEQRAQGQMLHNIWFNMSDLRSKQCIDEYFSQVNEVKDKFVSQSGLCDCEEEHLDFLECIFKSADSPNLRSHLQSVSEKLFPGNLILHCLSIRFDYDSCIINESELMFLLNYVCKAHLNGAQDVPLVRMIILSEPQEHWIAMLTYLNLLQFYKTSLANGGDLEAFILAQKSELLIHFNLQVNNTRSVNALPLELVQNIFSLLMKVKQVPKKIYRSEISNWQIILKGRYWYELLEKSYPHQHVELEIVAYYVLLLESGNEQRLELLINMFTHKNQLLNLGIITNFLKKFVTGEWSLKDDVVKKFTNVENSEMLQNWQDDLSSSQKILGGSDRGMSELIDIIDSQSSSETLRTFTASIKSEYSSEEFIAFKEQLLHQDRNALKIQSDSGESVRTLLKALATIDELIYRLHKFRLRETQKLSICMLLAIDKNGLLQVSTGEGKTLIVAITAMIKALRGDYVDIVTSSSVLAQRDATINKDLFSHFGVTVSHNGDSKLDDRIFAYNNHKVVYGEISAFQRDYLLQEFYGKVVTGKRKRGSVIVDEVDSMLLDKGNNMLYLSHELPWMDKLTPIYVFIWQRVNQQVLTSGRLDVKSLMDQIQDELFGKISSGTILTAGPNLTTTEVDSIWKTLVEEGVITEEGTFKVRSPDLKAILGNYCQEEIIVRLQFIWSEIATRERLISIPNYLKKFVTVHVHAWISSAYKALCMREKENYIVDVDKTGSSLDISPKIIILDMDTGSDLGSSQWEEALHQFLELKHGCKLSAQSLKAVFVSNVSYFKNYDQLQGLTGTLGTHQEQKLLNEIHNVDFLIVPTAKPKRLIEHPPIAYFNHSAWENAIKAEVLQMMKKRSVLIICETVEKVEMFKNLFMDVDVLPTTYTRDYQEFNVEDLEVGKLLISTNLAGRGTDIKISQELIENGGLHVLLTYLPSNSRVEQQAYGRAARCGQPGSARSIFLSEGSIVKNVVLLQRNRDNEEQQRLSDLKRHYENTILVQEKCFEQFAQMYSRMNEDLKDSNVQGKKENFYDKVLFTIAMELGQSDNTDIREILSTSLLDEWALWLDSMSRDINNITCNEDFNRIVNASKRFSARVVSENSVDVVANKNPSVLIKFGKALRDVSKYSEAILLLDKVIEIENENSEIALYHKAIAIGLKSKWADVATVEKLLKESRKHFTNNCRLAYVYISLIENLKTPAFSKIVKVNAFKMQQMCIAELNGIFINSIDDILGHPVNSSQFNIGNITNYQSDVIYQKLIDSKIISSPKVVFSKSDEAAVRKRARMYGFCFEELRKMMELKSASVFDAKAFSQDLMQLSFPNADKFWDQLKSAGLLTNEEKYYVINFGILNAVAPLLENEVRRLCNCLERIDDSGENTVFLSSAPEHDEIVWVKSTDIEIRDGFLLDKLVQYQNSKVYEVIKKGFLNKKLILAQANVNEIITRLPHFSSVKLQDFIEHGFQASEASKVLEELVQKEHLILEGDVYHSRNIGYDFSDLELTNFPCYTIITKKILRHRLSYQNTLLKMITDPEACVVSNYLPCNTTTCLIFDLFEDGILQQSLVIHEKNLKAGDKTMDNYFNSLPKNLQKDEVKEDVSKCLSKSRSIKYELDTIQGEVIEICKQIEDPTCDLLLIMQSFTLNGIGEILTFREKKWTLKAIFSGGAVLVCGTLQLVGGLVLQILTGGLAYQAGGLLVSEGSSDIKYAYRSLSSATFSWSDYGRHKLRSMMDSALAWLLTAGLSIAVARFVPATSFAAHSLAQLTIGQRVQVLGVKNIIMLAVKQSVKTIGKDIGKKLVLEATEKFLLSRTAEFCERLCKDMVLKIGTRVAKHGIHNTLREAHTVMGSKEALLLMTQFTDQWFSSFSLTTELKPLLSELAMSVSSLSTVPISLSDLIVMIPTFKQKLNQPNSSDLLGKFCNLLEDMVERALTDAESKLSRAIARKNCSHTGKVESDVPFETFKFRVTEMMQQKLNRHVGDFVNEKVMLPLIKMSGGYVLKKAGTGLKNFVRSQGVDLQQIELLDFEESTEIDGDDVGGVLRQQNTQLQERVQFNQEESVKLYKLGTAKDKLIKVIVYEASLQERVYERPPDYGVHFEMPDVPVDAHSSVPKKVVTIRHLREEFFSDKNLLLHYCPGVVRMRCQKCSFVALARPRFFYRDSIRELAKELRRVGNAGSELIDHCRNCDGTPQFDFEYLVDAPANVSPDQRTRLDQGYIVRMPVLENIV